MPPDRPKAMIGTVRPALSLLVAFLATAAGGVETSTHSEPTRSERQYTFSWMFRDGDSMKPRGGTTRGTPVQLADTPDERYLRLQEPGLSDLERDRRAILAMAGAYRTSFEFIETIGFTENYRPTRPYQSWATEYVYVVTDEPHFISLQHILVMTFAGNGATPSEPMVVKHWRQDWRYEPSEIHVYAGHRRWQRQPLDPEATRGAWSQAVFQVDDSPRYQAHGRWQHRGSHATWTSSETWRPLPRREFSVRDDYQILAGSNRVTIVPLGWIHEEDNLKVALSEAGGPAAETGYLAREAGLNRYERIVGHDFSAGDAYWARTGAFWAEVRDAWTELFRSRELVELRARVDDRALFQVMFALAERFAGEAFDATSARREIDATLGAFTGAREADGG